ncbi:MAG: DUF1501 domain-containing protein [Acidobacteria bacterium]|nr:DUF1501 domain-containing protein [Acidobacteriota bacterium]MCI0723585.1 DUF1501 domain-containing protein [Acidobacteriota bacterium]
MTRREMLKTASNGFGLLALSALLADNSYAGLSGQRGPHFPPKAKNVIFCFMPGGVSHMDSFDPKPKLAELDLKPSGKGKRKWLKCPWKFSNYGQSGLPVSELFPHIATCVDDLAVIRSMKSELPLHAPGNIFLHTGRNISGFPSLGSWVTYGLGSENQNLPGYLLLHNGAIPPGGLENFSNGFLPATYQAMEMRAEGTPIDNLSVSDKNQQVQKAKLDAALQQDRQFARLLGSNDSIESAISNYEMAYRMQSLVPDVLNLDKEPEATKRLYGLDASDKHKRQYGLQCLRARRLVEAGVRFVEITCPSLFGNNGTWDQHTELKKGHETNAMVTDQAIAALIQDLKARGLFQETLLLWAGEFGRTPDTGNGDGRDHHPAGYTIWMAGGGIKRGIAYGATDEIGNEAVENPVTIHDLHATILHLLGLDHEKLTYRFGGRDMRLTDVHGKVLKELIV